MNCTKLGYLRKYKKKWKRLVKKYRDVTVSNQGGSKDEREWIQSVNIKCKQA